MSLPRSPLLCENSRSTDEDRGAELCLNLTTDVEDYSGVFFPVPQNSTTHPSVRSLCSVIRYQTMTPPTLSGLRSRGGLVGPPPRAPLPPRGPPRPRPGRPRSPKLISSWDVMSLAGLRKWWSLEASSNWAWYEWEKAVRPFTSFH